MTSRLRTDKNRIDKKTTTDRVCLLLAETPFVKISHKELQAFEKRHGAECLLQAADIAAETWRRNPEERHNPGGYLNTLCSSLVVPEWYVPFSERKKAAERSPHRKEVVEAEKASLVAQEEAERAAAEEAWDALSDKQRVTWSSKSGHFIKQLFVKATVFPIPLDSYSPSKSGSACCYKTSRYSQ